MVSRLSVSVVVAALVAVAAGGCQSLAWNNEPRGSAPDASRAAGRGDGHEDASPTRPESVRATENESGAARTSVAGEAGRERPGETREESGVAAGVPRTAAGAAPPAGSVLPAALVLNDEVITVEDVLEPIRPRLQRAAQTLSPDAYHAELARAVRRQLLEEISDRLVCREASRQIDDQRAQAIEKAVDRVERDRINAEFGGREARYERYLSELGKSRADVRERLKRRLVVDQYLRDRLMPLISVRRRDLERYYERHRPDFSTTAQVELKLIEAPVAAFLKTALPPTEVELRQAREDARRHIEECLEQVRAGRSFEEVARERSRGLHREDGGSWGLISEPLRGRYETPSRAAFTLSGGAVSDVIETPGGCFLVKAARVRKATVRPFEEVQAEITEALRDEQFADLRARFIQRTLARTAVGDIEPLIRAVVARVPERAARSAAQARTAR